jgi:uncharacterized protein (DUF433 family)
MSEEIKVIKDYRWIVYHPDLLGGQPTVKGTRISIAQVLECLSIGMTSQQIANDYEGFPADSVPEVLKFAAEQLQKPLKPNVAA